MLRDENFTAKIRCIAPFEFDLIYSIIELYNECIKGSNIMIKDPILTKQVGDIMSSLVKLVGKGYSYKRHVQFLRSNDMKRVLRGVIGHFVGDPTLIFRALVTYGKILKWGNHWIWIDLWPMWNISPTKQPSSNIQTVLICKSHQEYLATGKRIVGYDIEL